MLELEATAPPGSAPGVDAELARRAAELDPSSPPAGQPADRPADAPPGQQPAAPPIDYQGDATLLVQFMYDGVQPVYPKLERVYTEPVRARLAHSVGKLMEKYQLSLAAIFARWEPEIRCAMIVLPLVTPTVVVIREQRAADRAAAELERRKQPEQANPNAPAST